MAVVSAALVIGSYGRTVISHEGWHGMQELWERLGFWANSLIFVLVGMLAPTLVLGLFDDGQWIVLVILIVTAMLARFLILFGLLPIMWLRNRRKRRT